MMERRMRMRGEMKERETTHHRDNDERRETRDEDEGSVAVAALRGSTSGAGAVRAINE